MKNILINSVIPVTLVLTSSNVFAGEWVKGYGESIKEAIETAKDLAEFRISQRGKGCVDGKTQNLKKEEIGGEKLWTIEIYTHNQNGSCGIDANAEWIKNEASKLTEAYMKSE